MADGEAASEDLLGIQLQDARAKFGDTAGGTDDALNSKTRLERCDVVDPVRVDGVHRDRVRRRTEVKATDQGAGDTDIGRCGHHTAGTNGEDSICTGACCRCRLERLDNWRGRTANVVENKASLGVVAKVANRAPTIEGHDVTGGHLACKTVHQDDGTIDDKTIRRIAGERDHWRCRRVGQVQGSAVHHRAACVASVRVDIGDGTAGRGEHHTDS